MKKEIIGICPVCGDRLQATKLTCHTCGTEISGDFSLSKFSYLSKEELQFVETFVCVQGNLKEMEKEFGISYPTIKKTLETIIRKLGPISKPAGSRPDTSDIIQKIKSGELDVTMAVKMMKGE